MNDRNLSSCNLSSGPLSRNMPINIVYMPSDIEMKVLRGAVHAGAAGKIKCNECKGTATRRGYRKKGDGRGRGRKIDTGEKLGFLLPVFYET